MSAEEKGLRAWIAQSGVLDNLFDAEGLEARAGLGVPEQCAPLKRHSEEGVQQTGIPHIEFGAFDQPLANICEVGRKATNQKSSPQQVQKLCNGVVANANRAPQPAEVRSRPWAWAT